MISVVIPVCNERESLEFLHDEIVAVAIAEKLDIEMIFVDDGSKDGSWEVIGALTRKYPDILGIRFRRNFGKAAALSAAFGQVHGDIVLTLDGDLQDDPREIPRFLVALAGKGESPPLDVVTGWKKRRQDPWHKVGPSRVFNWMVSSLTGVRLHDHNCGMKAYRAEVLREIRLYGELHRFIPVLAVARGFKVGEIEISHRKRRFGASKYGAARFLKGFLDILTVKFLTGYGRRPQHLLGGLGLVSFILGNLGLLYMAVTWLINNVTYGNIPEADRPFRPLHERPLLIYSLAALLLGAQMMSIGFLAELITAYQSKDEDSYSVAERVQSPSQETGTSP
jgi:glycosyltransferase involved in cell wall biosynthesis